MSYIKDYDERSEEIIGQGETITMVNGNEYNFEMGTSDKTITKKYGASPVTMVLRVFTVPENIASKIGGPKPKMPGSTVLKEYYVPSGSSASVKYEFSNTSASTGSGKTDAPKSAEPVADIRDELGDDGVYYIKASKDPKFLVDVNGASKGDGTNLLLYERHGGDNQKFRITKVKDDQYTIQCMHSGKWWTSSGKKGTVVTQSGSEEKNATTFTITKQTDGTYRIMDSNGLYVVISGGKVANLSNIILWTEPSDQNQTFIFEKVK